MTNESSKNQRDGGFSSADHQPCMGGQLPRPHHTGPDNPTEAALGFLVAMTAQKEGHTVTVFLAGDGASLITDPALGTVEGKGTGNLNESFDALIAGGAHIFISGGSAKARNITDADLASKSAEFATPAKLVELAATADVVMSF